MVVERRVGPHDLAAVVGRDLQSFERADDLLFDGIEADVIDEHVERMRTGVLPL
jgi:hypothetical protein